jgi:hypothetical protein
MRIDAAPPDAQVLLRNSSGPWQDYPSSSLTIIAGAVIRICSERLPHGREQKIPVFLRPSEREADTELQLELAWPGCAGSTSSTVPVLPAA